jgi:hypothetical protein
MATADRFGIDMIAPSDTDKQVIDRAIAGVACEVRGVRVASKSSTEWSRKNRLRRTAARLGLQINKSRRMNSKFQNPDLYHIRRGIMIIINEDGGHRACPFCMTLEEVEKFLNSSAARECTKAGG